MGGSSPCQIGRSVRRSSIMDSDQESSSPMGGRRVARRASCRNMTSDSGLGAFRKRHSARNVMDTSANGQTPSTMMSRRRSARKVMDSSASSTSQRRRASTLVQIQPGLKEEGPSPDSELIEHPVESSCARRRCSFKPLLDNSFSGLDEQEDGTEKLAYLDLSIRPSQNKKRRSRQRPGVRRQHSDMHLCMTKSVGGFSKWVDQTQAKAEKLTQKIAKAAQEPDKALKAFVEARVDTFTRNIRTLFQLSQGHKK